MKKKPNYERILSILVLLLTLAVVLWVGLSDNDLEDLTSALLSLSPVFLLLCLLSWMLYIFFNALASYHFLRIQGQSIRFREALHAAMVGIYYCNITPGATGGQPMEMYCLSKYGVSVGVSGSSMAVRFIVFQTVLLITGAVLWLTHGSFVMESASGSLWFVLLGYVANFFSIGMVMMMAISQRAVRWVIQWCIRIGVRLHICKDPDASREKWENHCQSFLGSVQQITRSPKGVLIQALIALGQLLSLMLSIIAVYHAFGLSGTGNDELITLGVLTYIGASYVPLPGASGAQEGGFAAMFSSVFPAAQLFVALLIWRFSTYYLSLIAGAIVTSVENILSLRKGTSKATEN